MPAKKPKKVDVQKETQEKSCPMKKFKCPISTLKTKLFGDKKFPTWGWFFVFFAIVFTMNGIMFYFADTTWNGLSTEDAYEKGLAYNQTLEQAKYQKLQGWKHNIAYTKNDDNTINVEVTTYSIRRFKLPKDAISEIIIYRPTQAGIDQSINLKKTSKDGHFEAKNISLPEQGLWEIKVKTTWGEHIIVGNQRFDIRW